jgi:hypothetical protein
MRGPECDLKLLVSGESEGGLTASIGHFLGFGFRLTSSVSAPLFFTAKKRLNLTPKKFENR